jgi:hypothetical protein
MRNYRLDTSRNGGSFASGTSATTATSATRSLAVSPSTYRFRVKVTDNKKRFAYGYGPTLRVGRIQNTSSAITYSAGWTTSSKSKHSGGSVKGTSVAGRYASYTYTGRGFAIVGPRSSTRGKFRVYVDGARKATISERASSTQYRRVLYSLTLPAGTHIIKIVAAGGGRNDLDAILTLSGY